MKVLYWIAVVVISLALVVSLILFVESRDDSSLDEAGNRGIAAALIPS